jgi:outer membrane protein assembly factor BamB
MFGIDPPRCAIAAGPAARPAQKRSRSRLEVVMALFSATCPAFAAVLVLAGPCIAADWTLWGGANRNFHVEDAEPLADSWLAGGPPKLWERSLGEGYSAIAAREDTLYTMYRRDAQWWQIGTSDQEIVVAIDAKTGATKWEFAYDVRFRSDQGSGPHVMPQLVGHLLFAVGATGKIHALDARTGRVVWKRDIYQEFGGRRMFFGYSSHPLPYQDKLIVVAGGRTSAVVALDQKTGHTVWAGLSFASAYSSPILVNVGGRDQIVVLAAQQILAVSPADGKLLWSQPLGTDPGMAFCTTPVWDARHKFLLFAAAYGYGATALRVMADGRQTRVEPAWRDNKLQSLFANLLLIGDTMYLSRGFYGPAFLTAVDVATGKTKWSTREFAKASFVAAAGKLFILDEHGLLGLALLKPDGSLDVVSRLQALKGQSWTIPTVANGNLYLRDRSVVMAFRVGKR